MLKPGDKFDRYVIEAPLGQGGMGEVFRAKDLKLKRRVALKILTARDSVGETASSDDAERRSARLLREAQAAASFEHPNAVHVYDVGDVGGVTFLAMEYIEGSTLRALVGDASIPIGERVRCLVDIARALDAAHARGLVHRDVKPENVMMRGDGVIKVLDFGIARRAGGPASALGDEAVATTEASPGVMSQAGVIVGTPQYMAPEQLRGDAIDARADQFAWGVVAYELLSGKLPWRATHGLRLAAEITSVEPAPLGSLAAELPPAVVMAVTRAMSKRVDARFSSMADAIAALEPHASPRAGGPSSGRVSDRRAVLSTPTLPDTGASTTGPSVPGISPTVGVGVAKKAARRGSWAIVVALGIAAGGGAVFLASRKDGETSAASTASAPPPVASVVPTALVDLELPKKVDVPRALDAYRMAMQAIEDGVTSTALAKLSEAAELDPALALAQLRLAMWTRWWTPVEARGHYQRAVQLRAQLGVRDLAVAEAMEPCIVPQPWDWDACEANLAALATRFPGDSDIAFIQGEALTQRGKHEEALVLFARGAALDPKNVGFPIFRGLTTAFLGRFDEARALFQHARTVSRSAFNATKYEMWVAEQQADCAGDHALAKRWATESPDTAVAYHALAKTTYGTGGTLETVFELLRQEWSRLDPRARAFEEVQDRLRLDVLRGDFASAERRARELSDRVAASPSEVEHALAALWLLGILQETGRADEAAKLAEDFERRRGAWSPDPQLNDASIMTDLTPRLLAARVAGGTLARDVATKRRDAWIASWEKQALPAWSRYVWLYGIAPAADTRGDAEEAIALRARFTPLPPFRPSSAVSAEAATGKVYALAGRFGEAIPELEVAVRSCRAFDAPIDVTVASAYLGTALAATGKKDEACAAWNVVMDRWAGARTSRTRERVEKEMAKAGCEKRR